MPPEFSNSAPVIRYRRSVDAPRRIQSAKEDGTARCHRDASETVNKHGADSRLQTDGRGGVSRHGRDRRCAFLTTLGVCADARCQRTVGSAARRSLARYPRRMVDHAWLPSCLAHSSIGPDHRVMVSSRFHGFVNAAEEVTNRITPRWSRSV